MWAASFDTSVPVMPMATPMSALFNAGASFTPSPVMATNWPFVLERFDNFQFLLWGDPCVHPDMLDLFLEFL